MTALKLTHAANSTDSAKQRGCITCWPNHIQGKQQEACTQTDPGAFHTSLDQLEQLGQHHRVDQELPCEQHQM